MHRAVILKRRTLTTRLTEHARTVLRRCTKLCLRTLDTMLNSCLPIASTRLVCESRARSRGGRRTIQLNSSPTLADGMNCRPGRSRDSYTIRIVLQATFNSISRWQKRIEALDKVRVSREQLRDAANHARSIDTIIQSEPQTSSIFEVKSNSDLRLAFEIFHDVKKSVIDVWLLRELDFDLIQVAQRVLWRQ